MTPYRDPPAPRVLVVRAQPLANAKLYIGAGSAMLFVAWVTFRGHFAAFGGAIRLDGFDGRALGVLFGTIAASLVVLGLSIVTTTIHLTSKGEDITLEWWRFGRVARREELQRDAIEAVGLEVTEHETRYGKERSARIVVWTRDREIGLSATNAPLDTAIEATSKRVADFLGAPHRHRT